VTLPRSKQRLQPEENQILKMKHHIYQPVTGGKWQVTRIPVTRHASRVTSFRILASGLALLCLLPVVATAQSAAPPAVQEPYPFQNPNLPIEDRVTNIISLMTLREKIAFLSSRPSVPRLGIRGSSQVEGLHGLQNSGTGGAGRRGNVPATTFPQAIGMAETWDPDALHEAAAIEGYEARYVFQNPKYNRGGLVVRAPNADLGRDPRWGRTEECYGEDPFFNGTMAVAFIHGLQGDDPRYWQTASLLKHFFANSNEDGRDGSSSDFDEQLFRDYYSVPFRMGFEQGGARCFMASYNAWNGIPCTIQPVIKNVAMKEWGVDGIICTDAGSLNNMVTAHHYYTDVDHGAAAAVKAGINQFLDRIFGPAVTRALTNNLMTESDIDESIKGTLRIYLRLGLLDPTNANPYAAIGRNGEPDPWTTVQNKEAALQMTRESIVLLKNAKNFLPLDKSKLKSIAVIGSRANEVLFDWYSSTPPYVVTPFQGITNKVGPGVTVTCATNNDNDQAVKLAAAADVTIVVVGNHPDGGYGEPWKRVALASYGREAVDRKSITLEEEDLIRKVSQANPKTVVVLVSSFPYAINWTQEHVPAIVHMTHNSQELGDALSDVLFGDYNPAGRLVETWPKSPDQLPPMMDYNIRDGRTYMYFKGEPLYPFGYGLSYTTFKYSGLKTSSSKLAKDGSITVSVSVKNTGKRAGDEVVQLYVRHQKSALEHPAEELRGFKRVALQPGETKTVEILLAASSLGYWDTNKQSSVVEPGKLKLQVGASSADIRLKKTVTIVN
jgi:beta-glucosidase